MKPFLSITGRWKQHVEQSGMDKTMSERDQSLGMLMFYAGFSASLEASVEIAEYPEDQAMRLLSLMHKEMEHISEVITSQLHVLQPNTNKH